MTTCTLCNGQPPFNRGQWTEWTCPKCTATWKMARHWERDGWQVTELRWGGGDSRAVDMVKDSGTAHGELYLRAWVSEKFAAEGESYEAFMISQAEEELKFKLEEAETE